MTNTAGASTQVDGWLLDHLACPRDRTHVELHGETLRCKHGHSFPVVHGVPVMLLPDVPETHNTASWSLRAAAGEVPLPDVSDEASGKIDPLVQYIVPHTSGHLYEHLVGKLDAYPIPHLRLPRGNGRALLDIGCNWGRWTIAAAQKGYRAVGIDPNLAAIFAARRVAKAMDVSASFVVGDARYLPFQQASFDTAFSYSVIQHFSKSDARRALSQIPAVVAPGGESVIQMANAFGVRSLYHLARRRFAAGDGFDVRYWRPRELLRTFNAAIGPSTLSVDGFGGLGIQASDRALFSRRNRIVVDVSEGLRAISRFLPPLTNVADSLYISSIVD